MCASSTFVLMSLLFFSKSINIHLQRKIERKNQLILILSQDGITYFPFSHTADIHEMIVAPLADECTPITLRQDIERLAIAKMMMTEEQECPQQLLVSSLADVMLAADFSPVLESCSKILISW